MMNASLLAAPLVIFALASPASAQTIAGQWRVENGEVVTYSRCGDAFCSRIDTGAFKGGSIGRMEGPGPRYTGTVIDPESGTSYEGRAEVEGDRLTLTGCVAKVFCRSKIFVR